MKGQDSSSESIDSGICLPEKKTKITSADRPISKTTNPSKTLPKIQKSLTKTLPHLQTALPKTQTTFTKTLPDPQKTLPIKQTNPGKTLPHPQKTLPKSQKTPTKTLPHPQTALPKTPTAPPQTLPYPVFGKIFQREEFMENWDGISDRIDPSPIESRECSEGYNPAKFSPPTLYECGNGARTILEGLQSSDDCLSNHTRYLLEK